MSWIWIDGKTGNIIARATVLELYLAIRDKLDHMGYKVLFEIETAANTYITFRLEWSKR